MRSRQLLSSLLSKAIQLENNYEWLNATDYYIKASNLTLKEHDPSKTAQLYEQLGFSFFRAAFQAQTNLEFKERIKQAIKVYKKEAKLLEDTNKEKNQIKISHANALIVYTRYWIETNPLKKKELLERSFALESKVLAAYESVGDFYSIGKSCNHLLECLYYIYWFISDKMGREKNKNEGATLAEKAIRSFSVQNNEKELAMAYRFAGWNTLSRFKKDCKELNQDCQSYTKKALTLSQKIGDARLISLSYLTLWNIAQYHDFNPTIAYEYAQKALKYSIIAKDNYLMGHSNCFSASSMMYLARLMEDPEAQRESFKKVKKFASDSIHEAKIISYPPIYFVSYPQIGQALANLAVVETNSKAKQNLFEKAIEATKEGMEILKDWKGLIISVQNSFSEILWSYSETIIETEQKKKILLESQENAKKFIAGLIGPNPMILLFLSRGNYRLALVQNELAKIETDNTKKINLLHKAFSSISKSIEIIGVDQTSHTDWTSGFCYGPYYNLLGKILQQSYYLKKEKEYLQKAIRAYKKALIEFHKANLSTNEAESYWRIAQLHTQLGENQEASQNYESSSKAYDLVSKKIPQLKEFNKNYSAYMQAWSQIEQAKHAHSIEEYYKAKEHYDKAAKLLESSELWSYLAPSFFAWENVEEAESQSRKENTQKAKETFQKAYEQFDKAEKSFTQKIEEIPSQNEKNMVIEFSKATKSRGIYCQARILLEEAKLLDRKGKYLQSSKSYGQAAQDIETIIKQIETESERKEIKLIAVLCRAWQKMANAEETTSSEFYLEASKLFEKVRDLSVTKKTSLWALGNSSFCKGLAAGIKYQSTMNLTENANAKRHIKSAATSYLQAGFSNASEYAKATQRLFDAYVFMNQAESEVDPEKRAKQYQMAEKLLQIAAGSFLKAKQPEKTKQTQQILNSVREEKTLAVSLNEVLHAPAIASTTMSFATPTQTREVSVGLEQFEHANVQANLIAGVKEVKVGESFCLSVEFVNAGKQSALLTKVEDFIPPDFRVVTKPEIYRIENTTLNMKGKQIAPLKLVEIKIVLQPSKKGVYQLKPKVQYLDELGQNKILQLKSIEIKVEEVVLADRVSTGTKELDSLLLGGFPKEYTVALTGPPSDERELLIKNFLEAGTKKDQTTFYITTEATCTDNHFEKSNFHLFLCNPKPKTTLPDLPNITQLKGKTDLNNLNIALARTTRNIEQEQSTTKRICIEIVSDVLLDYGAKTTRKWISELITDLSSKGFTTLAVLDPSMHPTDQLYAILNLFDGEIHIYQTDDPLECKKSIQVKKLRGQDYIKNPICLTKQKR